MEFEKAYVLPAPFHSSLLRNRETIECDTWTVLYLQSLILGRLAV